MALKKSPRTHISVITKSELRWLSKYRANYVKNKWWGKQIMFELLYIDVAIHTSKKTNKTKIVCFAVIKSRDIDNIRRDLGLTMNSSSYVMHITLCEKILYRCNKYSK